MFTTADMYYSDNGSISSEVNGMGIKIYLKQVAETIFISNIENYVSFKKYRELENQYKKSNICFILSEITHVIIERFCVKTF